jgi:hypothetical protein
MPAQRFRATDRVAVALLTFALATTAATTVTVRITVDHGAATSSPNCLPARGSGDRVCEPARRPRCRRRHSHWRGEILPGGRLR